VFSLLVTDLVYLVVAIVTRISGKKNGDTLAASRR
jgi:hypothetical protein